MHCADSSPTSSSKPRVHESSGIIVQRLLKLGQIPANSERPKTKFATDQTGHQGGSVPHLVKTVAADLPVAKATAPQSTVEVDLPVARPLNVTIQRRLCLICLRFVVILLCHLAEGALRQSKREKG